MQGECGRAGAILIAAMAAFTWTADAAWAQSGPIRLVPGQGGPKGGNSASSLTPAPGFDVGPPQPGIEPGAIAVPQSVTSLTVTAPGADTAGIIGPTSGGYGPDLWQGSARVTLVSLMRHLPDDAGSAALRGLERRALSTSAAMPQDDGGAAGQDLLQLRVTALLESGHAADAAALIDAAGFAAADRLAPQAARADLLRYDLPSACGRAATRAGDADAFWRRLVVFCQAASGDGDQAQLGLSLLRDTGQVDPLFGWAMDRLLGLNPGKVPDLTNDQPDAVALAALRLAQGSLPADRVAMLGPAEAALLANAEDGDADMRLAAAERAAVMGAIEPDVLDRAYAAFPVPPDAKTQPLSAAKALPPAEGRALLMQTAAAEPVVYVRAELIGDLLHTAAGDALEPALSAAVMPLLDNLPPGQETAYLAPAALRAMLISDRMESAMRWRAALPPAGADEIGKQAARLWGALRLAFGRGAAEDRDRPAFLANVLADADGLGPARLVRLIRLRTALNDTLPAQDWVQALDFEKSPALPSEEASPRAIAASGLMRDAAAAGRRGEAALAAILAADGRPAGYIPTEEAAGIVRALMQAGFKTEARQFALEAAFGAGL